MSYYQETLKEFTAVPYPHADTRKVHKFLRETFGDNDIFQKHHQRRWVTVNNYWDHDDYIGRSMILFKDERDAAWFQLKWSKR